MEIKTKQITSLDEIPERIDIFIGAVGYETRCTFAFAKIKERIFIEKVCFKFKENVDEFTIKNEIFYLENGFRIVEIDGNNSKEITLLFDMLLKQKSNDHVLNIVVDYSSMTRIWYGEILNYFKKNYSYWKDVTIFFLYSLGNYIPPSEVEIFNSHVEPVLGYSNLSVPERPTALIIGLGYEKNRAYSLKEYLDAENVYLFIAENNDEEKYILSVYRENEQLIQHTPQENIFIYPLKDLAYTELVLKQLCHSLLNNYRIVLAPCGPKPFTLLSFIVASQINDTDVWRVSAGSSAPISNKTPNGEVLVYSVHFSSAQLPLITVLDK